MIHIARSLVRWSGKAVMFSLVMAGSIWFFVGLGPSSFFGVPFLTFWLCAYGVMLIIISLLHLYMYMRVVEWASIIQIPIREMSEAVFAFGLHRNRNIPDLKRKDFVLLLDVKRFRHDQYRTWLNE